MKAFFLTEDADLKPNNESKIKSRKRRLLKDVAATVKDKVTHTESGYDGSVCLIRHSPFWVHKVG